MIKRLKYVIGSSCLMLHWLFLIFIYGLIYIIPIFWLTWLLFNWFPVKYINKVLDRIVYQEDFWYNKWIENYN